MEQTDAIILRATVWSETSFVIVALTRDLGKLSAVAKGARRPKSAFEGSLDLLSQCRVVVLQKSGDSLDILTEAKLQRRYRAAETSTDRLHAGYYVVETLRELTEANDPHPELFQLTVDTIERLDPPSLRRTSPDAMDDSPHPAKSSHHPPVPDTVLFFELQMLRLLGHTPGLDQCVQCGGDLPAKRPSLLFAMDHGGLMCGTCPVASSRAVMLHRDTIETMQRWSMPDPDGTLLEAPLAQPMRSQMRSAIGGYMLSLVGHGMRTLRYLN
ncbi:MAG: DNA repair protein RecO [Planctomycetota bacterium]